MRTGHVHSLKQDWLSQHHWSKCSGLNHTVKPQLLSRLNPCLSRVSEWSAYLFCSMFSPSKPELTSANFDWFFLFEAKMSSKLSLETALLLHKKTEHLQHVSHLDSHTLTKLNWYLYKKELDLQKSKVTDGVNPRGALVGICSEIRVQTAKFVWSSASCWWSHTRAAFFKA